MSDDNDYLFCNYHYQVLTSGTEERATHCGALDRGWCRIFKVTIEYQELVHYGELHAESEWMQKRVGEKFSPRAELIAEVDALSEALAAARREGTDNE